MNYFLRLFEDTLAEIGSRPFLGTDYKHCCKISKCGEAKSLLWTGSVKMNIREGWKHSELTDGDTKTEERQLLVQSDTNKLFTVESKLSLSQFRRTVESIQFK